jgi:carbamoyltransferase
LILGLTKDRTVLGKPLRQGASALVKDGRLLAALAEERATRQKQASGFSASAERVLGASGTSIDDVDAIAVSTCCEPKNNALHGHPFEGDPRLVAVGHHLSHATLAFYGSGFERALVVVADGGGNILSGTAVEAWWQQPREQLTYYLGTRSGGLELVGRDFDRPCEVGLGELYRAFTYFLGWPSSRYASRVMALSAYGRRTYYKGDAYELVDGRLRSPLRNDPCNPIRMVGELGKLLSVDFGEPRSIDDEILPIHQDVAAYVQGQLEFTLLRKIAYLRTVLAFDCLCLAGGVALNVLANGRVARESGCRHVYVPPAPADDGQAIGNAVAASIQAGRKLTLKPITTSQNAALGPDTKIDSAIVSDALHRAGKLTYTVFENPNVPWTVAAFLAAGTAVVIYNGRSEFGPRALGQRSILADPRRAELAARLNRIKERDTFMPFAPAILEERATEWLVDGLQSPFMSFTGAMHSQLAHRIPAVIHYDGSARVQTIDGTDRSLLRRIVEEFYVRTGIPLVLNTSFNRGGEPIVESVDDAVRTFARMPIGMMVLGRFVVVKNLSPLLADCGVLPHSYSIPRTTLVRDGEHIDLQLCGQPSRQVIIRVQRETSAVVFVRHDFPLYGPYLEWLRQGRKVTTIRYRKRGVEVPRQAELPLFETQDYGVGERSNPAATVRVKSIRYQRFGELTADDAMRDGFESLSHMLDDFKRIYPKLRADDWVTMYGIELVDD